MRSIKWIIGILCFVMSFGVSFADIDMTVSPIRYELEADPGESITRTATLYNNSDQPVKIITSKSDFSSNWKTGSPSFVRYSEVIHFDQVLSRWIVLSAWSFTIGPKEKYDMEFTINVPKRASPWGHYWAVIFKNNNSESTSGTQISINADYWVLILLTVKGELNTQIDIDEPIVKHGYSDARNSNFNLLGDTWIGETSLRTDNCLVDFTNSNFDWLCFDNPLDTTPWLRSYVSQLGGDNIQVETTDEISWELPPVVEWENNDEIIAEENLDVTFVFPVKNTWNTHVKPKWKIKLIDENGDEIPWVWKKLNINELWAVIGTDVVDYIPINDEWGNVLPQSERNYEEKWEWFPVQTLDENWLLTFKNLSPGEYYTQQNISGDNILMPWERVCYRKNNKTITALIDMSYTDDNWEDIEFTSAKEIPIAYTEKYIGINPYVIVPLFLFIFIFFLLWIIALWKRKKCINKKCRKKIKRKLIRCPHCDTKQKKGSKSKKK